MRTVYIYLFFTLLINQIRAENKFFQIESSQEVSADTNVVLPPSWAFGILYGGYTNQEQTIKRINNIICRGYPIDAYWIDSWFWSFADNGMGPHKYIDFVADTVEFPNRKQMWTYMKQNNIKGGFWIWDCIFKTGNEKIFEDFLSKGFFRNTYVETNTWHNRSISTAMHAQGDKKSGTLCGNINFNDSRAIDYFKENVKHFFDEGADFLKLDRTSSINVCKAMFEITQEYGQETKGRGFILSHTGGMESEEYKKYPAKWTDDTRSDWNIKTPLKDFNPWVPGVAFKENIRMFTDSTLLSSKIPFLANDMGGFDMGITDIIDEELFIRWMQFTVFTPIVEIFSQPENKTSNLPYLVSEKADSLFLIYSHLRMKMFPYNYSYAHKVRLFGKKIINTPGVSKFDYLFGDEILVAPVFEKGANTREVSLPSGIWFDYYTNKEYSGGKKYVVDAPVDIIPLFVKRGSIIPLRNYARSIEKGTNDTLELHIYLGEEGQFSLIEDDGLSNDYLKGIYATTEFRLTHHSKRSDLIIYPIQGNYSGINNSRVYKIVVNSNKKLVSSRVNGKKITFKALSINKYETEYFHTVKANKVVYNLYY